MYGQIMVHNRDVGGESLASNYAFLFGNGLAWDGVVSATAHGVPVENLVVFSRSDTNYNRSYVETPIVAVPEPSSYAWCTGTGLSLLALTRGRRCLKRAGFTLEPLRLPAEME